MTPHHRLHAFLPNPQQHPQTRLLGRLEHRRHQHAAALPHRTEFHQRPTHHFTKDPRIPAEYQAGNDLYANNRLDRGHLARRADLTWGPNAEAHQANKDSFYFTNITPQMDDFNQSRQAGIWGRLENALYQDVDLDSLRCSVFAGPVSHIEDQHYRGYQIPVEYWKLILFTQDGQLKARAFLLTQDLDRLQVLMALDEFQIYQLTVAELEERTGLTFPAPAHEADDLHLTQSSTRPPLDTVTDIMWRTDDE